MPNNTDQKHRTNRVFKSMHKPLTYLGVERTLFYFVCVGAVGAFNLFNSILAGIAVFIGGFAFGHWVTNSESTTSVGWWETSGWISSAQASSSRGVSAAR
jgi:hypothetical protein